MSDVFGLVSPMRLKHKIGDDDFWRGMRFLAFLDALWTLMQVSVLVVDGWQF
jgi:hypothetical protein